MDLNYQVHALQQTSSNHQAPTSQGDEPSHQSMNSRSDGDVEGEHEELSVEESSGAMVMQGSLLSKTFLVITVVLWIAVLSSHLATDQPGHLPNCFLGLSLFTLLLSCAVLVAVGT